MGQAHLALVHQPGSDLLGLWVSTGQPWATSSETLFSRALERNRWQTVDGYCNRHARHMANWPSLSPILASHHQQLISDQLIEH